MSAPAVPTTLTPWRRTAAATGGLYLHFIRLAFLKFLAYRLRYYTGVLSYTIFVAGHYYLYGALFASRVAEQMAGQMGGQMGGQSAAAAPQLIGGLTLQEMITYVAVSWIGRSFYFNNIHRDLSRMIEEGSISLQLIKPYHMQNVMMFEAVGESGFRLLMFSLPILIVVVPLFGISGPAEPVLLAWTFLSFCMALVIYSQFNFLLGCLAFHMKNIQGVMRAKMVAFDFLTGVIVPFTFFPEWFQTIVSWLPFQYISYVPVTIYLGKRTGAELAAVLLIQAVWSVGLWLLARWAYDSSVRRVTVQGG